MAFPLPGPVTFDSVIPNPKVKLLPRDIARVPLLTPK
jgi:hypothetical protein